MILSLERRRTGIIQWTFSVHILTKSLAIYAFFAKNQSVDDVDKLDDFSEQWAGFASIVIMGEQGK